MKTTVIRFLSTALILLCCQLFSFGGNKTNVKILLDDFENTSIHKNSDGYTWLKQVLPYTLRKILAEEHAVVMMGSDFESKKNYGRNYQLLDKNEILAKEINYRIIGSYEVREYQSILITITLIKYKEDGTIEFISDDIEKWAESINEIEEVMMEISQEADALIHDHEAAHAKPAKKIGVFCYKQLHHRIQKIDSLLGEDLANAIYYELKSIGEEKVKVLEWKDSEKYCNKIITRNILTELRIDAYVTGQVQYLDSANMVKVESSLVIKGLENPIRFPVIDGNIKYYYEIENQLAEQLNSFMSVAIDSSGEWSMAFLKSVNNLDINVLLQSAHQLYKKKEYVKSELILNMAKDMQADNEQVLTLLAKVKLQRGQIKSLVELCDTILALNPASLWTLQMRGEIYKYYGENEKALEMFNKIIAIDSSNSVVHYYLGATHFDLKNYTAAIEQLNFQLKTDTLQLETKVMLAGSYYYQSEKNNEDSLKFLSLKLLNDAVVANDDAKSKKNVARIMVSFGSESSNKGDYETALTFYLSAIKLAPSKRNYEMARYTLIELGNLTQLDSLLLKGVANDVWKDTIYYITGNELRQVLDKEGKSYDTLSLKCADLYLEKYIMNHPNSAVAYKTRGSINFRLKDNDKALNYYETALKKDSTSKETLWIILDIAEVSIMAGKEDLAVKTLNKINEELLSTDPEKREVIEVLKLYLKFVALTISKEKTGAETTKKEMEKWLTEIYIEGWGYGTLKNWISSRESHLSSTIRKELLKATKQMEARSYIN